MNRFRWVVGGDSDRLKLAALCQFTLPHPPIVYYGTEVGLSQRRDLTYPDGSRRLEESRLPMRWGSEQDLSLREFYRRLIAVRRRHPSLWRSTRTILPATSGDIVAVALANDDLRATVAFNRGPNPTAFIVPPHQSIVLTTTPEVRLSGGRLTLPPRGGALLHS